MGTRVCVRCQTPVVLGADFCAHCGEAVGHVARDLPQFRMARYALEGGTHRAPGQMTTFAKLRWLPFPLAAVIFVATFDAIPGMAGAIAAPVMSLVAFGACAFLQARSRAMVRREREE